MQICWQSLRPPESECLGVGPRKPHGNHFSNELKFEKPWPKQSDANPGSKVYDWNKQVEG